MLSASIRRLLAEVTPPLLVKALRRAHSVPAIDGVPAKESVEISVNVHGAALILPRSHSLPHFVARYPFYDSALPALASFLRRHKTSRLNVVDVGANFGDTAAIIAASIGRDGAQFVCVEADAQYIPWLRRNTEGMKVDIVHAIAGPVSGVTQATMLPSGAGTSAIVSDDGSTARMIAVDDLSDEPIDLLKIDTDGFELEVLRGATRVLSRDDIAVFLEYSPPHIRRFGGAEPTEVLATLGAAGFEEAMAYDNIGIPIGIFPCNGDVIAALSSYAERRADFYLDLLLARDRQRLRQFFALEVERTRDSAVRL